MSRASLYSVLALLALILLAFSPVLSNDFVDYDDTLWILGNPAVYPHPPSLAALGQRWIGPFADLYSPLSHTCWFLLSWVAGTDSPGYFSAKLSAAPFHGFSLLLHLATTLVVYRLLVRYTAREAAYAGAALFALHPLTAEAIAWASGLKDVLFTGFFALSLLVTANLKARGPSPKTLVPLYAALGLAMLSKPTAVVVPIACLLLPSPNWKKWPAPRPQEREELSPAPTPPGGTLLSLLPSLLLILPFAILTARWQPAPHLPNPPALFLRPLLATDALGHYLFKFLLPVGLTFDYGRDPAFVLADHHYLFDTLFFFVVTAAVLFSRDRLLLLGFALFLLPLLPVSGLRDFDFLQFSSVTDHYAYPALIGLAFVAARLFERASTPRARKPLTVAAAALGLLLAGLTRAQAATWQNSETFLVHAIRTNPTGILANLNYSSLLVRHGQTEASLQPAFTALQRQPTNPQAHYAVAVALAYLQRSGEALPHFEAAASMYRSDADYHANYGAALGETGHLESSLAEFHQALALDPKNVRAGRLLPYIEAALAKNHATTRP